MPDNKIPVEGVWSWYIEYDWQHRNDSVARYERSNAVEFQLRYTNWLNDDGDDKYEAVHDDGIGA